MFGRRASRVLAAFVLMLAGRVNGQTVQVTSQPSSGNQFANTSGLTAEWDFKNTGSTNQTLNLGCYVSGQVTSCSVPSSHILPPGSIIPIYVTFSTGAAGSGTLQLHAYCDPCSFNYQAGPTYTVVQPSVAVTAVSDTVVPRALNSPGFTAQFTVTNLGTLTTPFTLSCQSSTNVTCTTITPPSLTGLGAGAQAPVTVTYGTVAAGWGWAQLTASNGTASASAVAGVQVVPYTVAVTPDAKSVGVLASATPTQSFTVQNVTSGAVTYTFAVLCSGTAVSNCSQPASQSIPAGSVATINVSYTTSATLGATGRVRLQASGTPGQDSGWVNVTVGSAMAPDAVDVTNTTPGTRVEPKICLTVAAGRGAAYECGDLRIVHPLPTTRTMNKPRTPTLMYNSQHANPYPLVAANVSLNAAAATPDSVVATLLVNSVTHGRGHWNGADWIPGSASRIVVADTTLARAAPLKDTVYSYTLQVVNYYGATPTATTTTTSKFAVVNRSASPFGLGWWLAGFEHLDIGTMTWSAGDGALRQYTSAGTNVWAALTLDHPDTLKFDGTYYRRILPHGDTVKFDGFGKHVATVNRLGHVTTFAYDGCSRLQTITLPPASANRVYTFTYASPTDCTTKLVSVTAPPLGSTPRPTTLTVVSGRVTAIQDPDNTTVHFTYGTGADTNRIVSRTDRRGTVTSFTYDLGKKLARASIANGTGWPAITTRFRAVQSYGLAGTGTPSAIDTALAYTRLDGPRVDAGDTTLFWESKFFAPYRIVNALGAETKLLHDDSNWRALVTHVVYPNGRALGAVYDDRGNLLSVTDSSVFQNGRYATTRYVWNRKWDFDSIMVRPDSDSVVVAYDPTNGNRLWQQDGRGAPSETDFFYYSSTGPADSLYGLFRSIRTPSQLQSSSRDSVTYNGLGNLSATKTPSGFWTRFQQDNVGRDTLTLSPTIDTLHWQKQRIIYDIADHVTQTEAIGPQLQYVDPPGTNSDSTTKPESLWVATFFNPEGLPDSVQRWTRPNWNGVNTLTTRWTYDPAGRKLKEAAPDFAPDSTVYDAAGNAVKLITRRGHTITLTYDVLNRLSQRVTPPVTYSPWNSPVYQEVWYFPGYRADASGGLTISNDGTYGLTIAADTETFRYDTVGNMVAAINSAARVHRGYNRNGTIAGDTLIILPYEGTDTTLHVYGLGFTYDLDGRRTSLIHPTSLAPGATQAYKYDRQTGTLDSLTDALGHAFVYTFDLENRVTQLDRGEAYLGAGVPQVRTTYTYDADGRDSVRTELLGTGPQVLHRDTLLYDAHAKVTLAKTATDSTTLTYTGLGALAWSYSHQLPIDSQPDMRLVERHVPDALGNLYESTHSQDPFTQDVTGTVFDATTGRLVNTWHTDARGNPTTADAYKRYDPAGNVYQDSAWNGNTYAGTGFVLAGRTASYYDAGGRLRVQDHRTCLINGATNNCDRTTYFPEYNDRAAFEEYRYDALGRRVLVRTRSEWICGRNCRNAITRVVWDGNQILWEISSQGNTSATVAQLEQDTGQVVQQEVADYAPYGRVVYTHGAGLDAPLGLLRFNYSDVFPGPYLVLPIANWQGQYDLGTVAGSPVPSVPVCLPYPNQNSHSYCFQVGWPAPFMWKTLYARSRGLYGPNSWMGSLIEAGRDATGQMYRRNRYYDPATGRFTQEDPLGLAGGLNLYGFAGGDPVNFSDPFGLCPPQDQNWTPACDKPLIDESAKTFVVISTVVTLGASAVEGLAVGGAEAGLEDAADATLEAAESGASQAARAGETAATQAGREAHEAYSAVRQAEGFTTNRAIPGTRLRPDAIDPAKGIIRELKPNNPAAIRRGLQQLKAYKDAAERAYPGTKFTTFLDTY